MASGPNGPLGVLLASHLSRTNGHVCQVSVAPEAQGHGLGALLMTSALRAFRAQGLTTASLSVTVENRHAYRLYERLGFQAEGPEFDEVGIPHRRMRRRSGKKDEQRAGRDGNTEHPFES